MEVQKVEIKKELVNIQDDKVYVKFVKTSGLPTLVLNEGEIPVNSEVTATEETYEVVKTTYNRDEPKRYLVKVDDRKLFNDLVEITDSLLQRAVEDNLKLEKQRLREATIRELESFKSRVLNKPFHRRLLYLFTGKFMFPSFKDLLEKYE